MSTIMFRKQVTLFPVAVVLAASLCVVRAVDVHANADTDADPVSVVVYYESLCPYCRHFITTQLYPTFMALSSRVLEVHLVPFGIAWERQHNGEWQFACMHGPDECLGNQIATCAINATSYDPVRYLPLINCMEMYTDYEQQITALNECAGPNNISEPDIVSCLNSPDGGKLQHQMALITQSIQLQYTPWIVVNGVHNNTLHDRAYSNLLQLVCETYRGPQPDGCSEVTNSPILG